MPASTSQRRTKPKVRRNSDVIELALDGADGNLQIDWFDPSRARVTYLWEGMPPWLLHQTSSRRVSGGWDISDRLATYQFRTDNNKAALQELDHYAKSARRLSHS